MEEGGRTDSSLFNSKCQQGTDRDVCKMTFGNDNLDNSSMQKVEIIIYVTTNKNKSRD